MKSIGRIAVLGAGANGAAVAADLAKAGRDVCVIDPWPNNVEAIRSHGVLVKRASGPTSARMRAHHVSDVAAMKDQFDVVILGVKAYDTRWACELIRPRLADDGVVVGIQNGMTMPAVAEIVGARRTVGAVIEVAAEMFTPGVVRQQAPMWFALGAVDPGAKQYVSELADMLSAAGTATETSDIISAKWMKLVANAAELVTSAVLDLPLAEAARVPQMYELMCLAGAEAATVAVAAGNQLTSVFNVEFSPNVTPAGYARALLDEVLASYTQSDTLTTVLQDWRKGRRAEIDEINGHVVHVGGRLGVPTPINQRVHEVATAIQDGRLEAQVENVELLTRTSPYELAVGTGPRFTDPHR